MQTVTCLSDNQWLGGVTTGSLTCHLCSFEHCFPMEHPPHIPGKMARALTSMDFILQVAPTLKQLLPEAGYTVNLLGLLALCQRASPFQHHHHFFADSAHGRLPGGHQAWYYNGRHPQEASWLQCHASTALSQRLASPSTGHPGKLTLESHIGAVPHGQKKCTRGSFLSHTEGI